MIYSQHLLLQVMLVVICGIRKAMECIFKNHELRLLDDLLPSFEEEARRRQAPNENKLDIENVSTKAAGRKHSDDSRLKKRNIDHLSRNPIRRKKSSKSLGNDFSIELDAIYKHMNLVSEIRRVQMQEYHKDPNFGLPQIIPEKRDKKVSIKSTCSSREKCLIYVKPKGECIFTPLHLQEKTVKEFKDKLEFKFGAYKFQASRISRILQKNKNMLPYYLDDDMMEYIQSNKMFDIEISESHESVEKIDLKLLEIHEKDLAAEKTTENEVIEKL